MVMTFDTLQVPAESRRAYWEHSAAIGGLPPLRGRHDQDGPFAARLVIGTLGAITIAEASVPAGECWRTRTMGRHFNDIYQLQVITEGEVLTKHRGRQTRLRADDAILVDPTQPIRFISTALTSVSVVFPRRSLRLSPARLTQSANIRIPGDRGAGALLSSLARGLVRTLDDLSPDSSLRAGGAVMDVLGLALAAHTGEAPPHPALVQMIYVFIEANLPDRRLSPASIAAAHHISVRQLHKLFEREPLTVTAHIRSSRLENCRRDLSGDVRQGRTVASIAASWGMPDPANFSRLFRSAYGVPPSSTSERLAAAGRQVRDRRRALGR